MSGSLSLEEGFMGYISLGEMDTVSRCESPGTAVCGCVHVHAGMCLWFACMLIVCVYAHSCTQSSVAHCIVGYSGILQWKDPWAGNQKV